MADTTGTSEVLAGVMDLVEQVKADPAGMRDALGKVQEALGKAHDIVAHLRMGNPQVAQVFVSEWADVAATRQAAADMAQVNENDGVLSRSEEEAKAVLEKAVAILKVIEPLVPVALALL